MNERNLLEEVTVSEAFGDGAVDDANGILKGVVLLTGGKTSLNRTHYTEKALLEAKERYEGANMFLDHPRPGESGRSIRNFGGVYKDTRIENSKLKADLHLVESARKSVIEIAKIRPAGIGLSIKDKGHGVEKDGVFFVEGFAKGADHSIDLVVGPSVNRSLFESAQHAEGGDKMDFKSLTVESLTKERPELIESIQNAGKAAILKELEESKASGQKSDVKAAKLLALIEADFPKDIKESVRTMIMPDDISAETAKTIITGQKQLVEALKKASGGKPIVTGMGHRREEIVTESADTGEVPGDDDFAAAFRS